MKYAIITIIYTATIWFCLWRDLETTTDPDLKRLETENTNLKRQFSNAIEGWNAANAARLTDQEKCREIQAGWERSIRDTEEANKVARMWKERFETGNITPTNY